MIEPLQPRDYDTMWTVIKAVVAKVNEIVSLLDEGEASLQTPPLSPHTPLSQEFHDACDAAGSQWH